MSYGWFWHSVNIWPSGWRDVRLMLQLAWFPKLANCSFAAGYDQHIRTQWRPQRDAGSQFPRWPLFSHQFYTVQRNNVQVTIKAAVLQGVIQESGVGVEGRSEDKHARVEAVRPTRIRSGWQLFSLEQLVHITQNLRDGERLNRFVWARVMSDCYSVKGSVHSKPKLNTKLKTCMYL